MNIGQFVAAEIIIILIINSVEKVLRIIDTIYDVLTALEKIGYVTDLELDTTNGAAVVENDDAFSVEAVDIEFGFPDDNRKIFYNFSFEIPSNAKVVLTGKTGSGKSLLLQIIAGFYAIEDGELYINGIPFLNYQKDKLHEKIGMAFPTNQLFEGTFRENITMGRNISDKEISEVVKLLRLNEYFAHQPKGIDDYVDSGGRRLPRSVIQKLYIARLIVGKPKLLLLEDPLQFLAEDEKKRIIDYLMDKKRNWTVVVVSDFYYWKEKCTQIIDLEK